jgi:diaminohydroxyphosphoribosylaminopyrimidine deaminase / 5-amino-6-(5-phosphoribosylamino)uracil reductase
MKRCIELALKGAGRVAPNPMVGSVLVHDDRIIGEGFHEEYGGPHAEVNCIQSVMPENEHLISSSTLYVSLEPCSHYGKTPPCTNLILQKKIPRVVIGCADPFPEVNGRGISILREAGVEVESGVLEGECRELNKRFFYTVQHQRPYIILKWASTANGMIASADGSRLMISNGVTNRLVHRWRSEEAAIMVGTNTALADDPSLNVRHWKGKSPVRVVVDRKLRLPGHLKVFDRSVSTIILNSMKDEQTSKLVHLKLGNDHVNSMITALQKMNIQSVLVEGGATLLQSFIDAGSWNEARVIINETLTVPEGIAQPKLTEAQQVKIQKLGTDRIHYFIRQNS